MSLELVRESARVSRLIGEDTAQTIIEQDIIVPDVNPDVSRILLLDGDVSEKSVQTTQDKILIDGSIHYKILYISEESEQSVKSINTVSDFSYGIDVINVRSGMSANVKYEIEHIDYEILNGRKINVKTILKVKAKAYEDELQDLVNDIRGIEDIQILKENVDVYCYLGENTIKYTMDERLEIPAGKPSIKEILRSDVKICGKDIKTSDNKVIAKGDINILTLYVGDNEEKSIEFMEHEVPFTEFIELDGVGENSDFDVEYKVMDYSFNPVEDSDGEFRILNGEVALSLKLQATEMKKIELVSDAYSTNSEIRMETQPFKVNKVIFRDKKQVVLKEIISVDGNSPDISEIFNVICKPGISEIKTINGSVYIEGVVDNSVLYVANNTDQPVYCHYSEFPFKHNMEIKELRENEKIEIELEIEHCNYSLVSTNEVELRIALNVYIKVVDQFDTLLITKIFEIPVEENKKVVYPSITIYFSQPGDNVWKIAKKYCTTMDEITKVNEFAQDQEINPGQQILITKKTS